MEQGQSRNSAVPAGAGTAVRTAIALAALLLFVWLARQALRGETAPFDTAIRDAIHARATGWLTAVMKVATQFGSAFVVVPVGLFAVWRFLTVGRRRDAIALVASAGGAEVIGQLLKLGFHRPRPDPFFGMAEPVASSFPSTHAMIAICFYGALAAILAVGMRSRVAQLFLWALAAALALLIGFSRVYLGVHYPSDVIGGDAGAVVWALVVRTVYAGRSH